MKNITNVVNFVRGVEPRPGRDVDLVDTVRQEIYYLRENGLTGTFLLQYDALCDNRFIELLKDSEFELGIWIETVQQQVEAVGEKWRGRFSWDWHNDVGFLIGYDPSVREKLIDEQMRKFKEIFGYYPKSIGSWHIDAHSLAYFDEKYEIDACCICRDQVGVDGYTMQGGYYNGAYYPTKSNMFCPDNEGRQINIPVFRMLGSDAIYAYDYQLKKEDYGVPRIPTLECASLDYGAQPFWIDSFFDTTFCGAGISHQYTQAGQENSFGWERRIKTGYINQMPRIKERADRGQIEVMTLGDAGRWYKSQFDTTPPQTLLALSDCINGRYKSVWFSSKYFRTNLFWDEGTVRFRDMYVFNNELQGIYLDKACKTTACEFRNCPVMDSALYGKDAGIYIDGKWDSLDYSEDKESCTVTLTNADKKVTVRMYEKGIEILGDVTLTAKYDEGLVYAKSEKATELYCSHNNAETVISSIKSAKAEDNKATFEFCGVKYGVAVKEGTLNPDFSVNNTDGKIVAEVL